MNLKRHIMKLRIGTRKSTLALWQANWTAKKLAEIGIESTLVKIDSFGDKELDLPIHKLDDKGVFTKALDDALLKNKIDIAVHSLKDVPTDLIDELILAAVPERGNPVDVLVRPKSIRVYNGSRTVATGSIRRQAFWRNKFPDDEVTGLRGNVPTRLKKIDLSNWYGGIFASAGLERLKLQHRITEVLDWMIPAPGQGAVGIVANKDSSFLDELNKIEHAHSRLCVDMERAFMNELEAGCSSPLGAMATVKEDMLIFHGVVLSVDGTLREDAQYEIPLKGAGAEKGREWAQELIQKGADNLLKADKNEQY